MLKRLKVMKKKWGIYVRMLRGYKFMKAILYKDS